MLDVVPREPVGARFPLRQAHVRQPGRWRSTTACPSAGTPPTTWVRVDDARYVRPRRAAADGGVPDQERARPAHQPGQARLLGGQQRARRAHPAAAGGGARAAARRGEAGSAAARAAGPASRGHELRGLPRALRFARAGVRRLRPDRRAARPRTWAAVRSTLAPPSPAAATARASTGLRAYIREQRQDDFVDNLWRKLLAYALGRSLHAVGRADDRRDAREARRATAIASTAWSRASSPARSS